MAGLTVIISRPACLAESGCIRQAVFGTAVLLLVSTTLLTFYLSFRSSRPVYQLAQAIHHIAAGERHAILPSQTRDEVGALKFALNEMIDQLKTEQKELLEENGRFKTVLNTMADGVLITDSQGIVRLVNPATMALFDISRESALSRSFAEVVRHHQLIDSWRQCQTERREVIAAVEVGRDLFLQGIMTPFEEQGVQGTLVILQDLTTIRHLQTVRRDFISNISHELRTPLASLQLIVETLQDGAYDDQVTAVRFLDRAAGEIDALTQMVEELLELSRIESGQVPLRLQETAVADLLLKPLDRLKPQAERAKISLALDLAPALPKALVDPERIHQIVTNLLHNAIKFTPEGGLVTLKAFQDSQDMAAITIMVRDTGIGIAKEELDRIFERFYKSDRARNRELGGTGLGLAISRHMVELHNGRIWAKSKENKGSRFFFTLPIA